ncbi:MAG: DUF695 domain-containing protein [Planctomycetaceae bacterium]|nr:DUF695 domain-containing protein [Planctomycetaceae bacterium]
MNQFTEMMETNWLIAQGVVNQFPILVRCISPLSREDTLPELTHLIVVYWEYEGDEQGLPLPSESELMEQFERRICSALANDRFGVLVGVQTINGRRTFIYYARNVEGFQDHLIEITEDLEKPYPIQIEADEDPQWNFFFEHIYIEPEENEGDQSRDNNP